MRTWVINTDFVNNQKHAQDMIDDKKAAAYDKKDHWNIDRIIEGDFIYLYLSEIGVVAYGTAIGRPKLRDCDGIKDYEKYIELNNFTILQTPFPAKEINAIARSVFGRNFIFNNTSFEIKDPECRRLLFKSIIKFYGNPTEINPEFIINESNNNSQVNVQVTNMVYHKTKRDPSIRQRYMVMKRDNFKCCLCGDSPAKNPNTELHIDHKKPWSSGGETVNDNLQTLCSKCNSGKSNLI